MSTSSWVWDGGRPCLDLINTLRDRKVGHWELLTEPANLADWLTTAAPAPAPAPVDVTVEHLERAKLLREAMNRLVLGEVHARDVRVVNEFAGVRPAAIRLDLEDGVLTVSSATADDPVAVALGRVAADAIDLLTADRPPIIRVCAADTCGLRFEDRSPAGNRQWCAMRRCGNREKARQHYHRRRS